MPPKNAEPKNSAVKSRKTRTRSTNRRPSKGGTNETISESAKGSAKGSAEESSDNASREEPEDKATAKDDEKHNSKDHTHTESHRSSHEKHRRKKSKYSRTKGFLSGKRFIFIIGSLLGLLAAHVLANHESTLEFAGASQEWLLTHQDSLPQPLTDLLKQAKLSSNEKQLSNDFAVGMNMYDEGYRPKHPVVMIPGVISSALENWGLHGTEECPSKQHYRKQMWGGFYMIRTMLLNKNCWLQHILLDENTGLDPPDFKVRAAEGIESADYFITGYWIWNKIIENLSALGYDQNTMTLASYDWRLGYPDLERRDGYFSKLKATIETNKVLTGEKTSLLAHSMGSQVTFYFLKWVEAEGPEFGNGGPNWVNDHVAHFVDISGSMLGTPKALVALLSGEMKDTVTLNQLAVSGLEKFFSRDERAYMLRTWPGIASMLPKGGDVIWGNEKGAPDDPVNRTESFGNFIRFAEHLSPLSSRNLSMDGALDFMFSQTPAWFNDRVKNMYSLGIARTRKEVEANDNDPSKWSNPLEVALPNAPEMKIFSLYGVGKNTERAYYYRDASNDSTTPLEAVLDYTSLEQGSVVTGPGDGTISLPCHAIEYWWESPKSRFNPGGVNVTIVEMEDHPDEFDLRGGSRTADHVDILGRTELNEDILRIVSGNGDEIRANSVSGIRDWVFDLDIGRD